MFIRDEVGADGLPMRFAVGAILMGILLIICTSALADFTHDARLVRFSADLSALDGRASAIYQQGGARDVSDPMNNTGTKETVHFIVPEGIESVVFGAMPDHAMPPGPYERNIIYFTASDGASMTMVSKAEYSSGEGPIILTPGSYELTVELVKDDNGMYVIF